MTKRNVRALSTCCAAFAGACLLGAVCMASGGWFSSPVKTAIPDVAADQPDYEAGRALELSVEGVPVNFRWIPAGKFEMGSPEDEERHWPAERRHEVVLTRGYWTAETETTQELWTTVMGENPSVFAGGGDLPVDNVSWDDCVAFISRLNEKYATVLPKGFRFALPTEAQWEYACRAGTTSVFSFGNALNGSQANTNGGYPYGTEEKGPYLEKTTPAKSYEPNAWGLYDMHGNVSEWCADGFDPVFYESKGARVDPLAPKRGDERVYRGGSWVNDGGNCRSAARTGGSANVRGRCQGMRLVLIDAPRPEG